MMKLLSAVIIVLVVGSGSAMAKTACPVGAEPFAGRCLPPDIADQVRKAKTVGDSPANATTDRVCCKRCSKGIPCGDSCISASKSCRKPPGCAC